ncbi:uncharacterized protein [Henckelia pumila]|uniref:uncharacterized protein isoform X1 n=1 Tax=Henckelia pumila TaxID=405737 RepID=UPI003C6E6648
MGFSVVSSDLFRDGDIISITKDDIKVEEVVFLTSLNKSLTRDILLLTSLFAVRNLALVLGNSGDEAVAIRSMALQNQHMTIGVIANPCLLSQSLTAKPMTQVSELVKERWPSMSEIELAKQKAQEIAARLLNNVDPMKRARVENGAGGGYT